MGKYSEILDAVRSRLLTSNTLPRSVYVRKRIYRDPGDALPALYLAPTVEAKAGLAFGAAALMDYPVLVAVVAQSAHVLANPAEFLDLRDTIRSLLWRTSLAGADSVFDSDYVPSPAYDLAGLDAAFDVSLQAFIYRSDEQRV